MNKVVDTHEPLIITRKSEQPVVMLSLEDFNAMQETCYLLSSSKNVERLTASVEASQKGEIFEKELIDE